jgi:hypothetical protein
LNPSLLQHDKMRLLTSFSHRAGLPAHLQHELGGHVALEMRVDKERPDLLEDFPHHLRAQVLRHQYRALVANTYIFQGCSPAFLDQVVSLLDAMLSRDSLLMRTHAYFCHCLGRQINPSRGE